MSDDRVPVVLVGQTGMLAPAREAVAAAGGQIVSELDWETVVAGAALPAMRFIIVAETSGAAEDTVAAALPIIDAEAAALGLPVIASFGSSSLDLVAALLADAPAQLLCEPGPADLALGLAVAAMSLDRLTIADPSVFEGETTRLRRLNEEVARIADVLSRLTRGDAAEERHGGDLNDRRATFAVQPMPDVTIEPGEIRRAIRARRMRDAAFGAGLFEEPAWDMILDLFAAELERTRVSVSSLCIAAAVAPTTALRWISKLTDAGLFERQPDPFDRRRAYMELSDRASQAMRDYVGALRRAGLSLA